MGILSHERPPRPALGNGYGYGAKDAKAERRIKDTDMGAADSGGANQRIRSLLLYKT